MLFKQIQSAKQKKRLLILVILLIIFGYFLVVGPSSISVKQISQSIKERLDNRPVKKILFIGNSRTYVNDLPSIVKEIGSSTTSPYRYQVKMYALGGYTFQDHYESSAVRKLLEQQWDYVVLQGASPENTNPEMTEGFIKYGLKLIAQIKKANSNPSILLLTAWAYDEDSYDYENEHFLKPDYLKYAASYQAYIDQHGYPPKDRPAPETFFPLDIKKHYDFIQHDYQTLSAKTDTPMVNVGEAFKHLLASDLGINRLTSDGNHPNWQGSYLAAVMLHVCFSKVSANSINYVPFDLPQEDAKAIRLFVEQFYSNGTCSLNSIDLFPNLQGQFMIV